MLLLLVAPARVDAVRRVASDRVLVLVLRRRDDAGPPSRLKQTIGRVNEACNIVC